MGMRPIDVLRSATSAAADLLDIPDRGVLAKGKLADIIAVAGDPTKQISIIEKPSFIILGGRRMDPALLQ